jgi:signal transduction histidine kinase
VALTVHSGQSDRPPVDHLSSGYGLTGLRERAELVGGELHAGPDGDGWLVGVRIPT